MAARGGNAPILAVLSGLTILGVLIWPRRSKADDVSKDANWLPARLTEYYPDLPTDAPAVQRRQEGGAYARHKTIPVITLDQHLANPAQYPFATVSADTGLEGRLIKVGFAPRVYFRSFPNAVFRIYDTGGNFRGSSKRSREGAEPFDIAVSYFGKFKHTIDHRTLYHVDWEDVLAFPDRLRVRSNS